MSDQELRDELMTLLVAGHETTATGLAWALERLVRHPDALERLRDGRRRVRRRGRQGDAPPAAADLDRAAPLQEPMEIGGRLLPGRRERGALHLPDAPPGRHLPGSARLPARALPRGPGRAPTPGSRSAAACVAAWARASRSSRCGSCCRRWRAGSSSAPPIRAPSEWCAARSSSSPSREGEIVATARAADAVRRCPDRRVSGAG